MNTCYFGTAPCGTPAIFDPTGLVVALWSEALGDYEWGV